MTTTGSTTWTDVARLSNLAEAGFIVDELIGLGIEARIHQLEEFNAASDRWSPRYLIQVPSVLAQAGADHVRKYLFDDDDGQRPVLDSFRFSLSRDCFDLVSWRALALLAIGGVVGFSAGQRFAPQNSHHRPPPDRLATVVAEINRPFLSAPAVNQPQYRLSFDRQSTEWNLETDRACDGVFETQHRFPVRDRAR